MRRWLRTTTRPRTRGSDSCRRRSPPRAAVRRGFARRRGRLRPGMRGLRLDVSPTAAESAGRRGGGNLPRASSIVPEDGLHQQADGAVPEASWGLLEPLDRRLFRSDYSDVAILGKAVNRAGLMGRRHPQPSGNGALLDLAFDADSRRTRLEPRPLARGRALAEFGVATGRSPSSSTGSVPAAAKRGSRPCDQRPGVRPGGPRRALVRHRARASVPTGLGRIRFTDEERLAEVRPGTRPPAGAASPPTRRPARRRSARPQAA